jgi:hypothetical protein
MWYPRQTKESELHDATRISVKERHLLEQNYYIVYKNVDGIRLLRTETNSGHLKHGSESLGSFKGLVNFVTS